jgi:hypothetical protein
VSLCACMRVYLCVRVFVVLASVYLCACVWARVSTRAFELVCARVSVFMCASFFMCACVCVYVCVRVFCVCVFVCARARAFVCARD